MERTLMMFLLVGNNIEISSDKPGRTEGIKNIKRIPKTLMVRTHLRVVSSSRHLGLALSCDDQVQGKP